MDEKNLVFVVVDDAGKFRTAPNQITLGELALKYRVLQMIAVSAHGLEDLAETAVVGDVVANDRTGAFVRPSKATPNCMATSQMVR